MAMLCVYVSGLAQSHAIDYRKLKEPYFIDSWFMKDVPLGKVINYKDSTITLNDFKDKLIILDFWFTHYTDCIAQFPKEDSLQKIFGNDIQFILVSFDSAEQVKQFFTKWEAKSGIQLPFPMIVSDTALGKAFRHLYDPHYAWIFPDGKIVAQTAQQFVTTGNINSLLEEWRKRKALFEKVKKFQKDHISNNDKSKTNPDQ